MCQGFYNVNMKNIKVIDDFLTKEQYRSVYQYFLDNKMGYKGETVPWYWSDGVVTQGDGLVQFFNMCYAKDMVLNHVMYEVLMPIIDIIKPMALHRIKANLTLNDKIQPLDPKEMLHVDSVYCHDSDKMTTGIYYVNSNNGYTLFEDGTKVESVANRFVAFTCNINHGGIPCSDDTMRRIVINFNWF